MLVRSLGAITPLLFLALVLSTSCSPSHPGGFRCDSAVAAGVTAYLLAVLVCLSRALFRDPFSTRPAGAAVLGNSFLCSSGRGTEPPTVDDLGSRIARTRSRAGRGRRLEAGCGEPGRVARPLAGTGPLCPGRRGRVGVCRGALRNPLQIPEAGEFPSISLALSLSTFALAVGIGWKSVLRARRQPSTPITRLVSDLGAGDRCPGWLRTPLPPPWATRPSRSSSGCPARRFVERSGQGRRAPCAGKRPRRDDDHPRRAPGRCRPARRGFPRRARPCPRVSGPASRLAVENGAPAGRSARAA